MNPNNLKKAFWLAVFILMMGCAVKGFAEMNFSLKPLLEARYGYEDNILQVSEDNDPQNDFVTNVLAGIHMNVLFDAKTRGSARYEADFRRFVDYNRGNRQDHLLSLQFYRRLRRSISLLTLGNLGLRSQSNEDINDYYKQSIATQARVQWKPLWASQFGFQFRHKSYPHNRPSNYSSMMLEGNLGRRMGMFSQLRGGYQFRTYNGSLDPRALQLESGEKMEGFRQTASVWFESVLTAKVLMEWKYQFELDIATEGLQRQTDFPRWGEQIGDYEGEHEDSDDENVDFNFMNHRVAVMLAWRLFSRSTVALYARHDAKFYEDWPVPGRNGQRHDNLSLLQIYLKQKLFSNLSARLQFSLEKNNSNDPMQEYTDRIYSIGLRFTF
ncbi:hypothetical protein ACFL6S_26525 [Candidatus Poribacteria bacterium]